MKNLAALAVGVLVLAGVLWLALGGGTPPVPAGPSGPAGKPAAPSKPSPQASASLQPPPKAQPPKKTAEPAPPRRKKVAPPPAPPRPKDAWKVLVVEKKTGKPVPGAQVQVLDISTVKDPTKLMREAATGGFGRIAGFLQEFGKTYTADSKGVAWIHPLQNLRMGALMAARKGNLWGMLTPMGAMSPPLKIEVAPVQEILVQVKNSKGEPVAGVPVGIGMAMGPMKSFPLRATTQAPSGVARFRHVGILFRERRDRGKGLAALLVPLKKPVEKEFDPKALPKKPIVFTLPPTGRVEIYVQGPKGPVADGEAIASISVAKEKVQREGPFTPPPGVQANPVVPVKGGKALFPFVGLGLELQVTVGKVSSTMMIGRSKPTTVKGPGPIAPGQTVTFRVALTQRETILAGRVLLPSGKPVSEKTLAWTLKTKEGGGSSSSSSILRTDKEGRFKFNLEDGKFQGESRTLTLQFDRGKPGEILEGKVDLSRDFLPGVTDVGVIRLRAPDFLVSGTVQDPQGKPVPGARILVSAKKAFGPDEKHFFWTPIGNPFTFTDPKGSFKVLGKNQWPELKLQAQKPGWYQPKEVVVPPGSTDVVLVLHKGGTVTASFLADPEVPLEDLRISLVSSGPNRISFRGHLKKTNQAVWKGLSPGSYDLEVRLPSDRGVSKIKPLAEIQGILVEAGKDAADPRLKNIDLRGKIKILDLEIVDREGHRITDAWVHWGKDFGRSAWYRKGKRLLLAAGEGKTLMVTASGYKSAKVQPAGNPVKVVLERGYKVRLVYRGEASLPEAPFSLGVDFYPDFKKRKSSTPLFYVGSRTSYFGKDGVLECWLSAPGKYKITWMLKKEKGGGWSSGSFDVEKESVIEVRDVPGPQTFDVSLPAKDLEKALKEYRW